MNTHNSILEANTMQTSAKKFPHAVELLGRILLVAMFLLSGLGKLSAYEQTAGYMSAFGIPGALLPLVIGFEVLAAIAIIIGWQVRITSLLLAGFTLLSALMFHANFADQTQMVMFLKNVSIAGAFLLLVVNGAGKFSVDARNANR
ncbi:MAG: DoxX family protein [Cellvibrio sp.]|uniref:DoxX family protein n=1 Tax=Cellvibrio sp. TaxID=1965322 RepID=UPI002717163E|nr:DoxX family protein [Cellvibrio sp.]